MRKRVKDCNIDDQVSSTADRMTPADRSDQRQQERVAILQFVLLVVIIFCLPELFVFIAEVQSWLP